MRFVHSSRLLACFFASILLILASYAGRSAAQETSDPCKELKSPQLIKEHYFGRAKYKITFPCLAKMIEAGNYKTNSKVWNDHILPVIDHYFTNNLNKEDGYELGTLLWRIMVEPGDESGAKAVSEFTWSERIKTEVSAELNRFYKPEAIKIDPPKATVGKKKEVKFDITYLNRADIPLSDISPSVKSEVKPEGCATTREEDGKVMVTGLKGGKQEGTLTVRDNTRGLAGQAQLMFSGRMSILWPIGGLAVTGGAATGAATTDGGTSTTLWVVTGVTGVVTGVLFYKYFSGGGVPFLSKTDSDSSGEGLALRFVPGPGSLEINVKF
jgi:hypothetical protein